MPEAIQVKKKSEQPPWKDVCCSRCYVAKSDKKKCKCRCKSGHHGEAYKTKDAEKQEKQ